MTTRAPFLPSSSIEVTSGSVAMLLLDVMPYTFTFPPLIWLVVLVVWSHMKSTRSPMMSVIAGPVPLYGTVSTSVWIALMKSMPHRCEAAPMPAFAQLTLSLFALMYAMSSLRLFAGSAGLPMIVIGTSFTSPMYSKSLSGSKPALRYSVGIVAMPMWWMRIV